MQLSDRDWADHRLHEVFVDLFFCASSFARAG